LKKAFSLLTAIIFIVVVATIGAISFSLLSTNVQKSEDTYLLEQSRLLARSATEYAILAVSGHDRSSDCLERIDTSYLDTYDINISLHYIGANLPSTCPVLDRRGSSIFVLIDTFVSVRNSTNPVTYHHRSIQKL